MLTKRGSMPFSDKKLDKIIAENAAKKAKGEPKTKNKKRDEDYGKNRPILLKPDGKVIGEPFAICKMEKKLEFGVAVVHNDGILFNVTSFERTAQKTLDDVSDKLNQLRFPRSLQRITGAGSDGRNQDLEAIQATVRAGGSPCPRCS